MASELVKNLIESGVHFGHRTSRWNPKMGPYIFGKRNLIHIIDIRETVKGILRAKKFLADVAAKGQDVLFVGTKRQARNAVITNTQRTGMHYVSERWLGGTLTNFRTIRSRLARLEELEAIDAAGMETAYSKKMVSTLTRELKKIKRNLEGIRKMTRLPGALVLVDIKREHIAAKEARKLHIPVVGIIDTDSDPDMVDIPIPGNDDAMRAIELIISTLCDSIEEGKQSRGDDKGDGSGSPVSSGGPGGGGRRRRSSRAVGRADDGAPANDDAATPEPAAAGAGVEYPPASSAMASA